MLFTCPNAACGKQYEIDPSRIPAGKTGFKCQSCGTLVPVHPEQAPTEDDEAGAEAQFVYQPKVTRKRMLSPALLGFLVVGIFLVGGGMAYFYMQYTSLSKSTIVVHENLNSGAMSSERRKQLMDSARKREQ